jgi:FkbM family methyltransferase
LSDHVGRAIFYCGELDRKITWVCSRLVRPGDCVFDIGANLGLVTFTMAALVGATGQVHAFEPNPQMIAFLEDAIERNGLANIKLHRVALGAREGELKLSVPPSNAGAASLVEARQTEGSIDTIVPVRTLSSEMSGQDIGRVRLVKIDVEGFEPEVLAGAVEFFSRQPADALLFELNDATDSLARHPTIVTLAELGYDFFSLPQRITRMRAFRFNPQDSGSAPRSHDFVAARRGEVYHEIAQRLNAM